MKHNIKDMEKKARLQKLQDELLQKMPPGITGKHASTTTPERKQGITTPERQQVKTNAALTEHRDVTINLMVRTAAQGLQTVPEAPMTKARKSTLRKLKRVHGKCLMEDEGIRLIQQAEAAAVQMYIKINESLSAQKGEKFATI